MHGGINVERSDIAPFDIFFVILRMIAPDAAPNVVVPRDTLAEVQENGAGWIGGADFLVIGNDLFRQNGRAVPFLAALGLGVIRFIAMHPADNDRIIFVG